jgi:outer membrane protein assembly factor BamB
VPRLTNAWVALACTGLAISASSRPFDRDDAPDSQWALPNQNLSSTRASADSAIDSSSIGRLRPIWRFRLPGEPGFAGVFASTPVVLGSVVYAQDLNSNVFALDRATGRFLWRQRFDSPNGGPNGLAAVGGAVFGNTTTSAFALDAATGRRLWLRRLTTRTEQEIDVAPVVADGLVYTSTIGLAPGGGKGALYALDARSGDPVWRFVTVRGRWAVPREAGGGGAWWPMSVDEGGRVYVGISNPAPWGGSKAHPNGGAYRGRALYTDSLLVLDGRSGKLLWYDQVVPHDIRDYDFAVSPVLTALDVRGVTTNVVLGAGKNGRVYAWDRDAHRRLWSVAVGRHRNDLGPTLPRRPVTVCPGLYGGVETPMAYSDGRLFVSVVDLCMKGSATGYKPFFGLEFGAGSGALVALDAATGRRIWTRRFDDPVFGCATVANDVVFTSTYDGWLYGLDVRTGRQLWRARARAGINACPAVDGNLLLVGAGADSPAFDSPTFELTAFAPAAGRR